jgi:hypothetical protein
MIKLSSVPRLIKLSMIQIQKLATGLMQRFRRVLAIIQECLPLIESANAIKDDAKKRDALAASASDCMDKWQPKLEFHIDMPLVQQLIMLWRYDPRAAVAPTLYFFVVIALVLYLLGLALYISRVCTRLAHIESFILPVGFAFTAAGQLIKLGLILFW